MKAKLFLLACLFSGLFMYSCDSDDNLSHVDNQLEQLFNTMYPSAKGVTWEMERGYYTADFWFDGYEAEAWFDKSYAWVMTEFDIPFRDLPEAVRQAFDSSEYADWRIDDVDQFDYPNSEVKYVIEVERADREVHLVYSADGTLTN